MERFTNKDFERIADTLTGEARLCGMIEPDEKIMVNRGNSEHATVVSIYRREPWAERSAYWLPRFSPKDTARVQYKALAATSDALRGAYDVIKELRTNAED